MHLDSGESSSPTKKKGNPVKKERKKETSEEERYRWGSERVVALSALAWLSFLVPSGVRLVMKKIPLSSFFSFCLLRFLELTRLLKPTNTNTNPSNNGKKVLVRLVVVFLSSEKEVKKGSKGGERWPRGQLRGFCPHTRERKKTRKKKERKKKERKRNQKKESKKKERKKKVTPSCVEFVGREERTIENAARSFSEKKKKKKKKK